MVTYTVLERAESSDTHVRASISTDPHVSNCVKNVLRHALMADIVTQSVTHVTFNVYESPIEDEIVALRLGQLAVRGDAPYAFRVRKTACKQTPLTWVTSDDIEDPARRVVMPPSGRFLLAPLLENATLDVVCHTSAGTGRQHTLFSCVHVARPDPDTFELETTGALSCAAAWNQAIDAVIAAMSFFFATAHPTVAP